MRKKAILIALCSLMLIVSSIFNLTSSKIVINANTEIDTTLKKYVTLMGTNWNELAKMYETAQVESFKDFLQDEDNLAEHVGILNVKNASLLNYEELSYNEAAPLLSETYKKSTSRFYILKIDYSVYSNNDYFKDGTQYNLISLVKEKNEWKVCEFSGYEKEKTTTSSLYETIKNKFQNYSTTNATTEKKAKNKRTIPTNSTTIRYGTYSNGRFVSSTKLNFHNYCIGVTAGECRGTDYNGSPRKAIIMAIKAYSWHYKIVPIDPAHGVDIKNTMQSYAPKKVDENPEVTKNYNKIKNVWMESHSGAIFESLYKLGSYDGSGKNKGELKQKGCKYLVNEKGKNFYKCVRYYYDNSPASASGKIRFFDENKNIIDQ